MAYSWTGNISFGLVSIPVYLEVAETIDRPHFHMLDKHDMSRIKYKLVNANSDQEVSRDQVVKGYEYKEDDYIILTAEDFKKANAEATKIIDIHSFVDREQIKPIYFVRPYYVHPGKKAEKSYALFSEALRNSNKVGIATIVMQAREHLCALLNFDNVIVLEILRFAHEIKKINKKNILEVSPKKVGLRAAEVHMAETLINEMTGDFHPEQFRDTYQEDLMNFIHEKIKKGKHAKGKPIPEKEKGVTEREGKVIDFMSLLKRSVEKTASQKHSHGS